MSVQSNAFLASAGGDRAFVICGVEVCHQQVVLSASMLVSFGGFGLDQIWFGFVGGITLGHKMAANTYSIGKATAHLESEFPSVSLCFLPDQDPTLRKRN